MSGSSSGRLVPRLALAVPFLAGVLSGCGSLESDKYPRDLKYLPRTDPIVDPPNEARLWNPDNPGQLDQAVARIGVPVDKGGVGGKALQPKDLPKETRDEVQEALGTAFATPRLPAVNVSADDADLNGYVEKLQLDEMTLRKGSVLYRRHCLHCHGLDGDGRGPTGPWLNPHPRDYRQGLFKFISTDVGLKSRAKIKELKPRREDLLRTLHQGIDGTSMPSFGLQTDEDLNQIVSYVIHLSLRGQVEYDLLKALVDGMDPTTKKADPSSLDPGGSIAGYVEGRLGELLKAWARSDAPNVPPPYTATDADLPESIRRGFDMFTNKKNPLTSGACLDCHTDFGRQVPFRYDAWGTLVRPANLTTGVYRGGRRPLDLYWRIRSGIPPSQMPAVDFPRDEGKKIDPYWDLVNFIQALPYPKMLPEEVRARVYSDSAAHPAAHASAD